jgi:hypothetical protein
MIKALGERLYHWSNIFFVVMATAFAAITTKKGGARRVKAPGKGLDTTGSTREEMPSNI